MSYHILASGSSSDTLRSIEQILQQNNHFQVTLYNVLESSNLPENFDEVDLIIQTEGTTEEASLNPVRTARQNGFTGPIIFLAQPENFSIPWITKLTASGVTQLAFNESEMLSTLPDQIEATLQDQVNNPDDPSYTLKRHQTALEAYRASIRATAHAINNFLTTINGRVQIAQFSYLQDDELPADKVRHDITQIGAAADRIQSLVMVMQGLTELNQAWHNSDSAQIDVQQLIENQIERIKQTEPQS